MISIIIPYYKSLEYFKELMAVLEPQLNKNIEVIVVDDGCNELELDKYNIKVIHLKENSGCAGIPRNVGIDNAKGEYILFIDTDDLVANNFISVIENKIQTSDFDYCFMSWRTVNNSYTILVKDKRPSWNCSCWGIIYKRELIGNVRFNNKKIAEDFDFNAEVLKGKRENIEQVLYLYRTNVKGSLMSGGTK